MNYLLGSKVLWRLLLVSVSVCWKGDENGRVIEKEYSQKFTLKDELTTPSSQTKLLMEENGEEMKFLCEGM
jgi:hypothetical protein